MSIERAIKLLVQQDPLTLSVNNPFRTSLADYRTWELAYAKLRTQDQNLAIPAEDTSAKESEL